MQTIRVGMIGTSEGNGHPFSFSAIINGYDDRALAASGWPIIYDYVRRRDASEFGIAGLRVTHAWTQDPALTQTLCRACRIPQALSHREAMLGEVDAVIIARDDAESHLEIAVPFLEQGLPVFIDKPLALDLDALRFFLPYLEKGQLMSCSGMRYARELDEVRASIGDYGPLLLVRGAIVLSWEKYAIHLIDALLGVVPARPVAVISLGGRHVSLAVTMDDGSLWQLDALGDAPRTFRLDFWGEKRSSIHEITDNFSMFHRLLWHFAEMVRTGQPVVPVRDTVAAMRLLIGGQAARRDGRKVLLSEPAL